MSDPRWKNAKVGERISDIEVQVFRDLGDDLTVEGMEMLRVHPFYLAGSRLQRTVLREAFSGRAP